MQTSRQVVTRQRKRDRVRGAIRRDASSSLGGRTLELAPIIWVDSTGRMFPCSGSSTCKGPGPRRAWLRG